MSIDDPLRTRWYQDLASRLLHVMMEQVDPHGDVHEHWLLKEHNRSKGYLAFARKCPHKRVRGTRVEGIVCGSPGTVVKMLQGSTSSGMAFDSLEYVCNVLATVDPQTRIVHYATKCHARIGSLRDYVVLQTTRYIEESRRWIVVSTSISDEDGQRDAHAPKLRGAVRAECVVQGWVVEPFGPGKSYCTMIATTDPKGWIPLFLVNLMRTKVATNRFLKFRKFLEEHVHKNGSMNPKEEEVFQNIHLPRGLHGVDDEDTWDWEFVGECNGSLMTEDSVDMAGLQSMDESEIDEIFHKEYTEHSSKFNV